MFSSVIAPSFLVKSPCWTMTIYIILYSLWLLYSHIFPQNDCQIVHHPYIFLTDFHDMLSTCAMVKSSYSPLSGDGHQSIHGDLYTHHQRDLYICSRHIYIYTMYIYISIYIYVYILCMYVYIYIYILYWVPPNLPMPVTASNGFPCL